MKKRVYIGLLCGLCLCFFTGCGMVSSLYEYVKDAVLDGDKDDEDEDEDEDDTDEELVVLSDDEEAIFVGKYVNEDRIREGRLYKKQRETLMQYRFAKEYMKEKYPDEEFHYFHITSIAESDTDVGEVLFYKEEDEENSFSVLLYPSEEDSDVCDRAEDNYINWYYEPIYSEVVHTMLEDWIEEPFSVYTSLNGYYGKEYDKNLSQEEIFALDAKKDVFLFIDADLTVDKGFDIAGYAEEMFRENKQYVSCQVYAMEGLSAFTTKKECMTYINTTGREFAYSKAFNTFDMKD